MAASSVANSESFKVTTPSDREIQLTRLFDAPRHLVFDVMTKPEHVAQWWGRLGEGYTVPSAKSTCARAAGGGGSPAHRKASWSSSMACIAKSHDPTAWSTRKSSKSSQTPNPSSPPCSPKKSGKTRLTADCALSIDRSSRHGHRDGHGQGRRDQLRPAGGSGDQPNANVRPRQGHEDHEERKRLLVAFVCSR